MSLAKSSYYNQRFYDYTADKSSYAADLIAERLIEIFHPQAVCDVGCGEGVWLAAYARKGVQKICGLDGFHVDPARLHIDKTAFVSCDLAKPFKIEGRFDLVQSFEVAEHLSLDRAEPFVGALTKAADVVVFSAAVPGQGGMYHINEQPLDFWRALFRAHGYSAYDPVRPCVEKNKRIPPWYRHNIIVYVSDRAPQEIREALKERKIPEDRRISVAAPLWYRLRCQVIKNLPFSVQQFLAKLVS